jgi:hypothetical protein
VILKEAWLTVLDGYRPGRQLILTQPVTTLGRAEHLPLPFMGPMNAQLELEHARIIRQANGEYVCEDNQSQMGVTVNRQAVTARQVLHDGDVIKMGTNFIRFNERRKSSASSVQEHATQQIAAAKKAAPPPPPPPKKAVAPSATTVASGAAPTPSSAKAAPIAPQKEPSPKQVPAPARGGGLPPPPPPPPRKS